MGKRRKGGWRTRDQRSFRPIDVLRFAKRGIAYKAYREVNRAWRKAREDREWDYKILDAVNHYRAKGRGYGHWIPAKYQSHDFRRTWSFKNKKPIMVRDWHGGRKQRRPKRNPNWVGPKGRPMKYGK